MKATFCVECEVSGEFTYVFSGDVEIVSVRRRMVCNVLRCFCYSGADFHESRLFVYDIYLLKYFVQF